MSVRVGHEEPTEYLRVSYSSLNTYESCKRKFEFDKLYPRRERTGEDFYAADVGKALHAGYQDYLVNHDKESAIWEFMQAFPYEAEFQQTNENRSFDASLATLEHMFEEAQIQEYELAQIRRPNTPAEILQGASGGVVVPAIEVPFEIRFKGITLPDGRGIAFIGYIDAIMRHYMSGLFRTLDIKTSRVNLADATAKYKFDTQQVPYGIIVDHVAQGEVDSFEVLYMDCYIDLLEPHARFYPFKKNRQDIQEWLQNKLLQFRDIQAFMESNYFPRTEHGCLFYNKPCRYLEPCMSRDRESLIEWFLLGEEPAPTEPYHPWIVADIVVA
jgi:ATP-dependent helicase/DNAse subunit B